MSAPPDLVEPGATLAYLAHRLVQARLALEAARGRISAHLNGPLRHEMDLETRDVLLDAMLYLDCSQPAPFRGVRPRRDPR